jgi:hypothetical protein
VGASEKGAGKPGKFRLGSSRSFARKLHYLVNFALLSQLVQFAQAAVSTYGIFFQSLQEHFASIACKALEEFKHHI